MAMAVCRDWRRAAREDVRFHALRVRAPLRVLHTAQGAATDPALPEIDLSSAQVCAHPLCTSSASPLHLLCTSSAPACTHPLHAPAPRTRSASPSRTRSAPPTPHNRVAPTPHPLHAPSPRTCFAPVRTHSASTPRIRSAAPTPHHLAPTTQHPVAPIPSVQAARFTDVALRRCLSAAGARLTSLTLHQLPAITASGLAPLRLLPKLATGVRVRGRHMWWG